MKTRLPFLSLAIMIIFSLALPVAAAPSGTGTGAAAVPAAAAEMAEPATFQFSSGGAVLDFSPPAVAQALNSTNWDPLSSGVDGPVFALAVGGSGSLYAGGSFTTAGGTPANRVAKWDGSAWSALGSGVDGTVKALAVDSSGNLYAGGVFSTAGGVSAKRVARWDGTAWSALGTGLNGDVRALAFVSSGNLYVGGVDQHGYCQVGWQRLVCPRPGVKWRCVRPGV